MSKHETPMLRKYWESVGGLLVEEFPIVPVSPTASSRWVDGLILPSRERAGPFFWSQLPPGFSFDGEEAIVVQVKARRLGMNVMGQAIFSAELVRRRFRARHVRSVILCTADDSDLRPLLEPFGVEVVVMPEFRRMPTPTAAK